MKENDRLPFDDRTCPVWKIASVKFTVPGRLLFTALHWSTVLYVIAGSVSSTTIHCVILLSMLET